MNKLLLTTLLLTTSLMAQTFNVSTASEFRTALQNAAQNGEDDTIVLADGTYTTTDDGLGTFTYLDNEIYDLTLIGSSAANVILSGGGKDQIFNHQSVETANLNIEKLTFMDGGENKTYRTINGGGFEVLNAEVQITDCNFTNNHAFHGGGFYAPHSQQNMNIINTTFSNNSGTRGGGFNAASAEVTLLNTTFNNNRSVEGGGFYAGNATIKSSTFTNNRASVKGGGFITNRVKIMDSNFTENSAYSITNSTVPSETIQGEGGGFYAHTETEFISIDNSIFHKNMAGMRGGGFMVDGFRTTNLINKSSFTENSTRAYFTGCSNGGAGFSATDTTIIIDSIIKNNHSDCAFGAMQLGHAKIVNSIISHNYSQFGPVIVASKLYMSNSIMNANSSGISIYVGTVDDPSIIKNTLFLDNNDSNISSEYDNVSPIISLKNNYMTTDKVSIQKFVSNNIYENVTLGFVDEANEDYHLTASSDLIDAGTNSDADKFIVNGANYLATDFADNNRSVGASMDIGIYEYTITKPTINSFTYSGTAKQYQEITFSVDYNLSGERSIGSIEYDYANDGTYESSDTHIFNEAKTYSVNVKVTDSSGEFSTRSIKVLIAKLPFAEMTDDQKLTEATNPTYYSDIVSIFDASVATATATGKTYVQNNPAEFSLVTQSAYNTALTDMNTTATASGIAAVLLSPSAYGLVSTSELNSSTSKALATGITQGKEYVQNNLTEFGLVTKSDVELTASKISGLSAGWTLVSTPLAITDLSMFDSASVIWVYNNASASWSAYSSDATTKQKIIDNTSVDLITTIPAGSGIWVQK